MSCGARATGTWVRAAGTSGRHRSTRSGPGLAWPPSRTGPRPAPRPAARPVARPAPQPAPRPAPRPRGRPAPRPAPRPALRHAAFGRFRGVGGPADQHGAAEPLDDGPAPGSDHDERVDPEGRHAQPPGSAPRCGTGRRPRPRGPRAVRPVSTSVVPNAQRIRRPRRSGERSMDRRPTRVSTSIWPNVRPRQPIRTVRYRNCTSGTSSRAPMSGSANMTHSRAAVPPSRPARDHRGRRA